MRSIILFLFFIGIFMICHVIYEQKYDSLKSNTRVEYRFIPRTYYEEQLSNNDVSGKMANMFNKSEPWMERNVTLTNKTKKN